MARTIIPDNYFQVFPDDWETFLFNFLEEKTGFRDSPLILQGVRQFIKAGLESEFLKQIEHGLAPESVSSSSRLADIYGFLVENHVWPIYGLGCNHCIGTLDPISPFFPSYLVDGVSNVAKEYSTILTELAAVRRRIHTETKEFIYTGTWRSINLWDSSSLEPLPATLLFPQTMNLLMEIPLFRNMYYEAKKGVSFKSFIVRISLLKSGSTILPHFGLTNTRLRLQIPLEIPDGDLFIYCHNEKRLWTLGEALILNDSYMHGVFNNTAADRIVLLIDLPHPAASSDEITSFQ